MGTIRIAAAVAHTHTQHCSCIDCSASQLLPNMAYFGPLKGTKYSKRIRTEREYATIMERRKQAHKKWYEKNRETLCIKLRLKRQKRRADEMKGIPVPIEPPKKPQTPAQPTPLPTLNLKTRKCKIQCKGIP